MQLITVQGVRVARKTRAQIRASATFARLILHCGSGAPNMASLLEHELPRHGVQYHFAPEADMGSVEALTIPEDKAIWLREDVYLALLGDDERARFTLAHELGHLFMHERPTLATAFYRQELDLAHPQQEDPEHQANAFAAEFLMPAGELAGAHVTAAQIARAYKVSLQAAMRRVRELLAEGLMRR